MDSSLFVVTLAVASRRCESSGGGALRASSGTCEQSLVLDAPVLKPNLDLLLGEAERRGHLDAAQTSQVDSAAERPFQFDQLTPAECRPTSLRGATVCRHYRLFFVYYRPASDCQDNHQDHQALLKAKYRPRVAAAFCRQKNTKKLM